MNNFEKIKQMTVEEMAEHLHKIGLAIYEGAKQQLLKKGIELYGYEPKNSIEGLKQWLLQEVEE